MLIDKEISAVLLVDVQEKLVPFILDNEKLVERCDWILRLAKAMSVPFMICEQYPKGLGATVASLCHFKESNHLVEKVRFSAAREASCKQFLEQAKKKQVILMGIEAHVCVLQTALELKKDGFDVFVVVDAIGSRSILDKDIALRRMASEGVHLVTSEMVFFEWIRVAGTESFKTLSKTFLQ